MPVIRPLYLNSGFSVPFSEYLSVPARPLSEQADASEACSTIKSNAEYRFHVLARLLPSMGLAREVCSSSRAVTIPQRCFMKFLVFTLLLAAPLFAASHGKDATILYLPHFTFKEEAWVTDLGLHNPTLLPQTVTVRPYDSSGHAGRASELVLPPFGGWNGSLRALLPFLDSPTGWLQLESSSDQISGQLQVTAVPGAGSSTVPLCKEAAADLVFTAMKQNDGWVSGFAVVNTRPTATTVSFHLSDSAGQHLASRTETLAGHAKRVEILAAFFPETPLPDHPIVTVRAEGPLTGMALSFRGANEQIVAVPAQSFTPATGQAQLATTLDQALIEGVTPDINLHGLLLGLDSPSRGLHYLGAAGMADPATGTAMTVDHPFRLASVGKSMTATLIMQLVEEGRLDLDALLADVLGADTVSGLAHFEGLDYSGAIHIRQLLNHTAGLGDHLFDNDVDGNGLPDLFERLLTQPDTFWTPQDVLVYARSHNPAVAPPGTLFHYSDLGYVLLGLVVEQITGQSLTQNLHQRIFEPLGMDHTWLEYREDPRGLRPLSHVFYDAIDYTDFRSASIDWGGGGEASTLADMLTYSKALLSGGLFQHPETLQAMLDFVPSDEGGYGFGIERLRYPGLGTFIGHNGFSGAFMYYWVEGDVFMVGTSNQCLVQPQQLFPNILWLLGGGWQESAEQALLQQGATQVGGVSLEHIAFGGQGPTVVFETGHGASVQTWAPLLRQVAAHAPVFAYNRQGYGESGYAGGQRDAMAVVADLQALLQQNQVPPPYILVGHSLGGLFQQYFARAYPDQVAGVVLVDSSVPLQSQLGCERFPAFCPGAGGDPADLYPPAMAAELTAFEQSSHEVLDAGPYPDVPGYVLTSGSDKDDAFPGFRAWWVELQATLASEAGFTQIVDPLSGHFIHTEHPQLVLEAINDLIRQTRP